MEGVVVLSYTCWCLLLKLVIRDLHSNTIFSTIFLEIDLINILINRFHRHNSIAWMIHKTSWSSCEGGSRLQLTDRPPHVVRRYAVVTPPLNVNGGKVYSGSGTAFKQMSRNFIRFPPKQNENHTYYISSVHMRFFVHS